MRKKVKSDILLWVCCIKEFFEFKKKKTHFDKKKLNIKKLQKKIENWIGKSKRDNSNIKHREYLEILSRSSLLQRKGYEEREKKTEDLGVGIGVGVGGELGRDETGRSRSCRGNLYLLSSPSPVPAPFSLFPVFDNYDELSLFYNTYF